MIPFTIYYIIIYKLCNIYIYIYIFFKKTIMLFDIYKTFFFLFLFLTPLLNIIYKFFYKSYSINYYYYFFFSFLSDGDR